MAHAILSPSSAGRWAYCPGSVSLHAQYHDTGSSFADEGSAAHAVAEMCLTSGTDAVAYVGRIIECQNGGVEVTADMAADLQPYMDYVRELVEATGGELLVEQKLPISFLTGEYQDDGSEVHGTADAVILADGELIVVDLKFGRGVKVDAERNEQLAIYASAALEQFGMLGDFDQVRIVVHQPRLGHVSEWALPVGTSATPDTLLNLQRNLMLAAERARPYITIAPADVPADALAPRDKACQWCRAKATCPALTAHVMATVADDFVDLDDAEQAQTKLQNGSALVKASDGQRLGTLLSNVDLVEMWCKAVRAEAESRLHAGEQVAGFKLVQGKKGNRQWADEKEAEAMLKTMRLKEAEMYDFKLISPTTADKLAKAGTIGPRQWPKLQDLIVQREGQPTVAPESDKRPAIVVNVAADFEDETAGDLV